MGTPFGDFVRARRDATSPLDLSLPSAGRRRVPGLRRTELASLAGISVEYLTRIEQGHDHNPSIEVVSALAQALGLDVGERRHLIRLAKASSGKCISGMSPENEVRPAVYAILDQLEPGIAWVSNGLGDILAYTSGFELLARPVGLLEDSSPNLTRFVFADERAMVVFPDWTSMANERAQALRWMGSAEAATDLACELSAIAGPEFTSRFGGSEAAASRAQRWVHPSVGEVRFDHEALELRSTGGQELNVLLPADDDSARAVDRMLATGRGRLGAVAG